MKELTEEYRKKVDNLIESIKLDREQLVELQTIAREKSPVASEIDEIDRQMLDLEKKKQALMASHLDATKDVMSDISDCKKSIERKTESLKNMFHMMPRELIEGGLRYSLDDVTISVSRAKFVTTYKTTQLLNDYPELEEVYIDGDPLCTLTIIPEMMDRLIERSEIEISDIDKYRIVTVARSPSVSVSFGGEK